MPQPFAARPFNATDISMSSLSCCRALLCHEYRHVPQPLAALPSIVHSIDQELVG